MSPVQTRYKNKKFVKERIELDGHSYENCTFEGCLIVLEKGEAEIKGCTFNHCRLMLLGQALRLPKFSALHRRQTAEGHKISPRPGFWKEKFTAESANARED
jgi:hypothetical protein